MRGRCEYKLEAGRVIAGLPLQGALWRMRLVPWSSTRAKGPVWPSQARLYAYCAALNLRRSASVATRVPQARAMSPTKVGGTIGSHSSLHSPTCTVRARGRMVTTGAAHCACQQMHACKCAPD